MELQQPVGTIIKIGDSECVIIGVVNDFHTSSLKQEQLPVIIYSHTLLQCSRLYVRYAQGSTRESFVKIESVYKKFEPEFTMKYHFLDETFDKMYKTEHTASAMLVSFTLISLVIAVIGVVGLATYTVAKKKKEISIKRVFGASVWQVLRMLCSEFAWLICVAAFVGLPLAWYGTIQWLAGYAYRIDTPWWIYVASFAGIMTITLLLILLQGLRATRANPSHVLRSE
jgi:ABC-type antimicrobial peptide transport system permease subunit